jgi:ubiquinone/menaquinone biosynthesis C-methylase UbiE
MSGFSEMLIARSGYEGEGFAAVYDAFRPSPPPALLDLLTRYAGVDRPRLVVDLGCGTGLSTRAWAGRAGEVVGVEANPAMAGQARAATSMPNARFVVALADATGLPAGEADVVTCAQSFHWMDPELVLAEAARLLRPGGVFAAYDYDVPPAVEPEVDEAFAAHFQARGAARARLGLAGGSVTWPKTEHLARIRGSGWFRFAREVVCHGEGETDARRLIGLAESIGGPRAIFGDDAPEVGETFERLCATAERVLGDAVRPMLVGYRARLGVV